MVIESTVNCEDIINFRGVIKVTVTTALDFKSLNL